MSILNNITHKLVMKKAKAIHAQQFESYLSELEDSIDPNVAEMAGVIRKQNELWEQLQEADREAQAICERTNPNFIKERDNGEAWEVANMQDTLGDVFDANRLMMNCMHTEATLPDQPAYVNASKQAEKEVASIIEARASEILGL